MKQRLLPLLLSFLLFATLCTGCHTLPAAAPTEAPTPIPTEAPTPEPPPDPRYVPGSRTPNSYTSKWLNLSYTLASDMAMMTDDDINAMMDLGLDAWDIDEATGAKMLDLTKVTVVYEMFASALDGWSNIMIVAEKPLTDSMTVDEFIMRLQIQLPYMFESVEVDEPGVMELLDVTYQTLKLSIDHDGYLSREWYLVRKQGDRIAYIVLLAPDDATIDRMLDGFSALA